MGNAVDAQCCRCDKEEEVPQNFQVYTSYNFDTNEMNATGPNLSEADLFGSVVKAEPKQASPPLPPAKAPSNDTIDKMTIGSTSLPEGWTTCVSESTGKTYYHNSETGESTFANPCEFEAMPFDTTPLPKGWMKLVSKNTGNTHYCNEETGEIVDGGALLGSVKRASITTSTTNQVRPSSLLPKDSFSVGDRVISLVEVEWTPRPLRIGDVGTIVNYIQGRRSLRFSSKDEAIIGNDYEIQFDEVRGWLARDNFRRAEDIDAPDDTSSTRASSEAPSGDAVEPTPLPAGWVQLVSKTTGKTYYYNSEMGESTYTHPSLFEKSDETELPQGWTKVKAKSVGRAYYYNTVTGESTFERPS